MNLPHFYCPAIPPVDSTTTLDDHEARHAVKAQRLSPDHPVALFDGHGTRAQARISKVHADKRQWRLTCTVTAIEQFTPPACRVHLLVSLPAGKGADQILREAAELGVWHITPVLTARSVRNPGNKWLHQRAPAEILAAAKQSGNVYPPALGPPIDFHKALSDSSSPAIAGTRSECCETSHGLFSPHASPSALAVWVGPEGGFNQQELRQLAQKGVCFVRVGQWTLRVETAVTALLAWVHAHGNKNDLFCKPH